MTKILGFFFIITNPLPGIEPGNKQTVKDGIWSWLSDLIGLENNENSNIVPIFVENDAVGIYVM